MGNIVIGIAGGTASGKTTIAKAVEAAFSRDEVVIIRQDNYYKCQSHLTPEERVFVDYDHPHAFDFDLLYKHMVDLIQYKEIDQPLYDFTLHSRLERTERVAPGQVLVLEGILAFSDKRLLNIMDIKVFVDTESDLRFIRRLLRDTQERGRTVDQSIAHYIDTAKPGHDQFVEPSKKKADIIIPYTNHNTVAIDMLIDKVKYFLSKQK